MNLPAHSFYPTRIILYDLCKQAGIKTVIFYCGESGPLGLLYLPDADHNLAPPRLVPWPGSALRSMAAGLCARSRGRSGDPGDGRGHPRLGSGVRGRDDGRL
jgi:hypothetical protein